MYKIMAYFYTHPLTDAGTYLVPNWLPMKSQPVMICPVISHPNTQSVCISTILTGKMCEHCCFQNKCRHVTFSNIYPIYSFYMLIIKIKNVCKKNS